MLVNTMKLHKAVFTVEKANDCMFICKVHNILNLHGYGRLKFDIFTNKQR